VLRGRRDHPAQGLERRLAVEQADVLGLDRREPANRPGQVNEVRLVGRRVRVHAAFLGQVIPLARVAGAAGRHHVGPIVVPTTRQRDQVVPRQALPMLQLELTPVAVLAAVVVPSEEESVGNLTAETARDVHELDKADDGGPGDDESFTSNEIVFFGLDDFRFAFDD